jgi:hypothetical protein
MSPSNDSGYLRPDRPGKETDCPNKTVSLKRAFAVAGLVRNSLVAIALPVVWRSRSENSNGREQSEKS